MMRLGIKIQDGLNLDKNGAKLFCEFLVNNKYQDLERDIEFFPTWDDYANENPIKCKTLQELFVNIDNADPSQFRLLFKYNSPYESKKIYDNKLSTLINTEMVNAASNVSQKTNTPCLDFYTNCTLGNQAIETGWDPDTEESTYDYFTAFSIGGDGYLGNIQEFDNEIKNSELFNNIRTTIAQSFNVEPKLYIDNACTG